MSDVTMLALVAVCFLAAQAYAGLCRRLLSAPAAAARDIQDADA